MKRRHFRQQEVFGWFRVEPPPDGYDLPRESQTAAAAGEYDTSPDRTREQVAQILTYQENQTVTASMVRTGEDNALDKFIAWMRENSELGRLILDAEPGAPGFEFVRQTITDAASEPNQP